MDIVHPLTLVVYVKSCGDVSHKGIIVTRECCPDIKWLTPGQLYVLTSSTKTGAHVAYKTRHFLHLQSLADVEKMIREDALPGVTELRLVPLRRNPWVHRPNESKTTAKKRRKRVASALRKMLWRYVMDEWSHKDACLCLNRRSMALRWVPMKMVTGPGWVASHPSVPPDSVWGTHDFNSSMVHTVNELGP